ncbi:MAG: DUF4424 family protein [Tabrizicola sp.]|nr:DUF4424 family protein [Tabrizicola sp.]
MMTRRNIWTALVCLVASPALANDGFGGFSATGLTFSQTEAVAMVEEDLYISPVRIRVSYLFRNLTGQDVTGEMIFPLPPIPMEAQLHTPLNLPDDLADDNLVGFSAMVNGVEVPVTIDRIAVIEPPYEEGQSLGAQYDVPGREVTAELQRLGLPLTVDAFAVTDALLALNPEARDEVSRLGLADYIDQTEVYPRWSIVLRYHWTQTFPAGADVRIAHDYMNLPAGGLLSWNHPAQEDYEKELAAEYCVDEGTSRAMARATTRNGAATTGLAYSISYVLRTANSWAGPIGRFRLTIDKGAAENVVSLCADGITKTGPTTFTMEKTDYIPTSDLEIFVLTPLP